MANGMVSIGIKISCMLSKDMSNGDAQVITAKEIPAMLPVLNSCASINTTSAQAKVMVHFCWSESHCWQESVSTIRYYVLPNIAIRPSRKLARYISREPPVSSLDRRVRSYKST